MTSNTALLNATFSALSDPTRRAIVAQLAKRGEASVLELAKPFSMSQPAITKHLKVLEQAGLITRASDGQRRLSRLNAKPMGQASAWLETYRAFWEARFDKLDELFIDLQKNENPKNKSRNKGTGAKK